MDGGVERFAGEVEQVDARGDVDHQIRVLLRQPGQARGQPAHTETGQDGEFDDMLGRGFEEAPGGAADRGKGGGKVVEIVLPLVVEGDTAPMAVEQRGAQPLLEIGDMTADGALREVEGRTCAGERAEPGGRLEAVEHRHWRQAPPVIVVHSKNS